MGKVTVKANTAAKVKHKPRKPVKAGSTMPRNIGGIANAKVVAIVKPKS